MSEKKCKLKFKQTSALDFILVCTVHKTHLKENDGKREG